MGPEDKVKLVQNESWAERELVFLHVLERASANHSFFMELLSTYCVPGTGLDAKFIL